MKPNARRVRSSAENTDPECVTSATGPAGSGSASVYPIARSPRATFTNPMHPAPHTAIPASRAIPATRSRSPARALAGGAAAAVHGGPEDHRRTGAAGSPRPAPAPSSAASGTASSARSTAPGRSASDG